jgi:striatin 1/3/4
VEDEENIEKVGISVSSYGKDANTVDSHLDAVRAVAFHPSEMCLATGGDDNTVKIWRMDVAGLTST